MLFVILGIVLSCQLLPISFRAHRSIPNKFDKTAKSSVLFRSFTFLKNLDSAEETDSLHGAKWFGVDSSVLCII